uniref:Putative terminase n=1 Tax=viral metagenome TaxID=1070528 RepID=A0A6H1ZM33_9ZZZZ
MLAVNEEVHRASYSLQALFEFIPHPVADAYIASDANLRVIIKGNQGGATATTAYDAVLRVLGYHPVKKRNVLNKPMRFISKVLPMGPEDEENQQYVEFKRLFPAEMIEKDVTARSTQMIVRRPTGDRVKVEFMSSKQDLDAFMSVQRSAIYQDEEIEKSKWDENQMRLLKEGGDTSVSLTPARGLDWTYDLLWCRASKIYRSDTIAEKFRLPEVEDTGLDTGIEVFNWATDDNPVMTAETIDRIFSEVIDEDDLAMRRYGVFKQASGKIYKIFSKQVHKISAEKIFDVAAFRNYWHFRIIDYHPSKPWYVSWVAITPTNEWFVWQEFLATSHDKCTTYDLRDKIRLKSIVDEDDPYNRATLIDPLSEVKQPNTGFSVFDDLRRGENGIRRLTPADTKNQSARDRVKVRLKNALDAEVPGNNINHNHPYSERYGIYMPTLWFLDTCPVHIEHFDKWRLVDFKQEHVKATRTVKRESEKWSDFCRNIEFLAALDPAYYQLPDGNENRKNLFLFQGRRQ